MLQYYDRLNVGAGLCSPRNMRFLVVLFCCLNFPFLRYATGKIKFSVSWILLRKREKKVAVQEAEDS